MMGASGTLLAFYDDIDGFLNAGMHVAPPEPGAEPLLPLVLRKRLEEQIPGVHAHNVPLSLQSGRAAVFSVTSRDGTPLENDEYFVNPYTGAILGQRKRGDLSQGLANLMPFILDLHKSLTLGKIGKTISASPHSSGSSTACSDYLTLPPRRESPRRTSEQWLAHWAGALARAWRKFYPDGLHNPSGDRIVDLDHATRFRGLRDPSAAAICLQPARRTGAWRNGGHLRATYASSYPGGGMAFLGSGPRRRGSHG